jgi:hypothetical protein
MLDAGSTEKAESPHLQLSHTEASTMMRAVILRVREAAYDNSRLIHLRDD